VGRRPDLVIVNADAVDEVRRAAYRAERADVVAVDEERFAREGIRLERWPLLGPGPLAQHDPERLARGLVDLIGRSTP
jgi:hypothetical protein